MRAGTGRVIARRVSEASWTGNEQQGPDVLGDSCLSAPARLACVAKGSLALDQSEPVDPRL
jgi:hypothetical protein